jgi:GNAT superfamily N-acetyltransferase
VRPRSTVLRRPRSLDEWTRYHDIRKRCIFNKYHSKGSAHYCKYDPAYKDEHDPANHPLIFLADGKVVGTIRIDVRPEGRTVFRLVAIDTPWQGRGLGTIMLEMAEEYAQARGAAVICLNSVPDAYSFYARHGFNPAHWDGCTQNETEIPVMKRITSEPMQLAA